jgi:hypothetical protein
MVGITVMKNQRGDFEAHLTGCAHIDMKARRSGGEKPSKYTGATLVAAIVAADTDMADWFCEVPYTESSRQNGCWRITNGIHHAPCFTKAVKAAGVTFEAHTGRPVAKES